VHHKTLVLTFDDVNMPAWQVTMLAYVSRIHLGFHY